MNPSTASAPAVLRAAQIAQMLGIDRTTLYRWIGSGHFPPPVRLGPNVSCWRASTVQEWLDEKFDSAKVA